MDNYVFETISIPSTNGPTPYPTSEWAQVSTPADVNQFVFEFSGPDIGEVFPEVEWEYWNDVVEEPLQFTADGWQSFPTPWRLAEVGEGSQYTGVRVAFAPSTNGEDEWTIVQLSGKHIGASLEAYDFMQFWTFNYDPSNSNDAFATFDETMLGEVYSFQDLSLQSAEGDDSFVALDTSTDFFAGPGNDLVKGGAGDDTLRGGADDDTISGGKGTDVLNGGSGRDQVSGNKGDDTISGGKGNDLVRGQKGNDTVAGNKGSDVVQGGSGDDIVRGNKGDDIVFGGKGDDTVIGGEGNDVLTGGKGADDFVFNGSFDTDRIADFDGSDMLTFENIPAASGMTASQFVDAFASVDGNNIVIDIDGAGELTLQGYTDLSTLHDDISLL